MAARWRMLVGGLGGRTGVMAVQLGGSVTWSDAKQTEGGGDDRCIDLGKVERHEYVNVRNKAPNRWRPCSQATIEEICIERDGLFDTLRAVERACELLPSDEEFAT